MEESRYVDPTLAVYRRLRAGGTTTSASSSRRTSTVPRATSRACSSSSRTSVSARARTSSRPRSPIRRSRASTPRMCDCSSRALRQAGFVGIATHDERMIEHAIAFVAREQIPRERFQFQMLYGVRPQLQLSLVRRGLRRARGHALRAGLVPLSHASPGRAAGEHRLPAAKPRATIGGTAGRAREPHRARP